MKKLLLLIIISISMLFAQDIHRYSTQEVMNMVYEDNTLGIHQNTTQEVLNLVFNSGSQVLNVDFATGDLALDGDLSINNIMVYDKNDLAGESLDEVSFTTHASWDITNDLDDSGGNAAYVWTANQTSTLTQIQANLAIAGVGNYYYKFVYTIAVTTAFDGNGAATITTGFAGTAQTLDLTAGTHTLYFKSKATPVDFVISVVSGTDTEGSFTLDDLSLKQITDGDVYITGSLGMGLGTTINEFSTDGTMAGNSDDAAPTEKAVVTYVAGVVGAVAAEDVSVKELGTATYDDVQDWMNNTQSSGITTGGGFTDLANGTITVAAGTGFIRATNTDIAEVLMFDWAAETPVTLTDVNTNYIYVDYNLGTPDIVATTTKTDADNRTKILLGKIYRDGNDLHLVEAGMVTSEVAKRVLTYLNAVNGEIVRSSGLIITETGTLNISMTAGAGFAGLTATSYSSISTDGADDFTYWYNDHTGWVSASISAIDNTNYNDFGQNPGLVALTANQYGVHWVYMDFDGDLHIIYGLDSYNLASAQDADAPANLPTLVADFSMLIARITIKKAEVTTFTDVDTPWETTITSNTVTDHGALGGLADDDHTQYILVDGTRAFSGDIDLGTNYITNTGGIDQTAVIDIGDFTGTVNGTVLQVDDANKDIVLNAETTIIQEKARYNSAPGSDHTVGGMVFEFTAGETVNFGDAVYQNADGELYLADATDATKMPVFAIALETITDGNSGDFITHGVVRDDTWAWTVGDEIYITITGTTGNTLSSTAPVVAGEQVQKVAIATHADRILVNISLDLVTI